ncbi:MAG TPA: FAD-dependent oxidoreductase [Kiritimatiellia bacterium]|nr:FAD-dependent oxidoreductase [Kiritimatiellia bacterium]HOR97564.1 FAD-dependent oxidoreductase [Kiritimatiellia bacterium]HRU19025.1 FAD-dependent oxidoreductase [Kiritimatiellia bacterium]
MRGRLGLAWVLAGSLALAEGVVESAKTLPLAHETDVVIVGGSSGAVAAACRAAAEGVRVFVVAPRPYLGEDMAGKLCLRTGASEDPRCVLRRRMFTTTQLPPSLPFSYRSDRAAASNHPDPHHRVLSDGVWQDAVTESAQFGGDVTLTLDLGALTDLGSLVACVFRRDGANGFRTGALHVWGSTDAETWADLGKGIDQETEAGSERARFRVPLSGRYRYVKVLALVAPGVKRQLLGELLVYPVADPSAGAGLSDRTTPLQVKKVLDEALLQAGVPFLTGALATETLTDETGALAGVVIANRSGRQAIRAKVVIDATERGILARAAGGQAEPFPAGHYTFTRRIVAGEAPRAEGVRVRELFGVYPVRVTGIRPPEGHPGTITGRLFECEIDLPMRDGSARAFAEAEQRARDLTFVPTQLESADTLSLLPPDFIRGKAAVRAPWAGVDALDLDAFQPAGTSFLFVLGPMADVARPTVEHLMRPGNLMALGERIGAAAARLAKQRPAPQGVRAGGSPDAQSGGVTVGEHTRNLAAYLRNASGTVRVEPRELPVLAECDVLVAGAGTGGAPAGIAAARHGARTLVCEYIHQMGGVQTDGLIGRYYFGNRVGFTLDIDRGVKETGAVFSQCKSEWYRSQNRKGGAEIWYGTMVSGVVVENNRLTGVVVVMPDGTRGVVRCRVAIDSTGNAELAAMAGEKTEFITAAEVALQGVGQTPRRMGASYTNTDIGFLDDTDASDLCFFALRSRYSMREGIWDQAQIINSRERRRMIGAFYMSPLDVVNGRTYPDVVVQPYSNFDSHGHTTHEQFFIEDPGHHGMKVNLPFRCLLPKTVDGLLVTGLGISAHRDAMPILRMQPDVQNQGYAAGTAAAMAIKAGVPVRRVDIRALQRHLIEMKILPETVLDMEDSFPLPDACFTEAVAAIPNGYQGLSVVLTDPARSVPLLKAAYTAARVPEARLAYAHVLGMMGHPDGETELIARVQGMAWDKGWHFRGMGQFNRSVSWLDSYLIALGRCRSARAVPAILDKAKALTAADAFSHFRAVALALEAIGDPAGAPVLGRLLATEGIGGYAIRMGPELPVIPNYANHEGDRERSACLRELALARALFRLGDFEGRGVRTLRAYAEDPRGAYATHAALVLGR